MLNFVWQVLWRRRERLVLVVLGIFLVSLASGLAAATARSTQGTIDEELAEYWRTDYDLLIRHPDSVSEVEEDYGIIPGNYQGNLSDIGITQSQLQTIRNIPGVEVAAPLSFLGFADVRFTYNFPDQPELPPGEYVWVRETVTNNGIDAFENKWVETITVEDGDSNPLGDALVEVAYIFNQRKILVIAVDPEAEEQLSGLGNSIISGVYFDSVNQSDLMGNDIPAMINSRLEVDFRYNTYFKKVSEGGNEEVLWHQQGHIQETFGSIREVEAETELFEGWDITGGTLGTRIGSPVYISEGPEGFYANAWTTSGAVAEWNWDFNEDGYSINRTSHPQPLFRPTGLPFAEEDISGFNLIASGYFDPDQMNIMPPGSLISAPLELYAYSPPRILAVPEDKTPGDVVTPTHHLAYGTLPVGAVVSYEDINSLRRQIQIEHIDSVRVRVSGVTEMSEQSQVRIAAIAQEIRDRTGLHVDIVLGSSRQRTPVNLYDYNNAQRESYRLQLSEAMGELVPILAEKTGLDVSWDFGSYPHPHSFFVSLPRHESTQMDDLVPVLNDHLGTLLDMEELQLNTFTWRAGEMHILIPDYEIGPEEDRDFYAQVEEYWIQLGTQMRIYHETNRATFWITLSLLAVGALFIGNTTYISAVGRTGEFATLRSLGWQSFTVFKASLGETLIISSTAGIVTAGVLAVIWYFSDRYLEPWLLLVAAPAVVLTFLIASVPPLVRILFISPLQGIKRGELKATTRFGGARPLGFILRGLIARPGRSLVTSLALIIPGGTLAFMFFIYFGIQALLGESLLGEYLAVELRGYHLLLNALIFAVAGLAVTDTLMINLRERQKEFGLLKAIGWRNGTVARLLFWEGVGLGLVGGVIGTVVAGALYTKVFDMLPPGMWVYGPLLATIPALVAGLAAIVPAMRAAGIPAAQAIKED